MFVTRGLELCMVCTALCHNDFLLNAVLYSGEALYTSHDEQRASAIRRCNNARFSIKGGTDSNPAEGDERANLQGFAEKVESAGALGGLKKKKKFQGIIEKLKAGQLKTKVASSTKFDFAIKKLQAGKKLTPLDTTRERWQNLFKKFKASGKLKGTTEEQVAKFTKEVAEEVVKKPSKWRYLKTAMKFAFGFALTALIVLGIKGMIGST
ncbi:unnamed protein product [Phytophthora lilii]|uniref:Unnamed protein product n=1 Tax=Phytophthora lilii TaxID=2077276 RepID=A0A9W6U3T4_9STRA|nr:unnamed protein product [Phytophthora lilii]